MINMNDFKIHLKFSGILLVRISLAWAWSLASRIRKFSANYLFIDYCLSVNEIQATGLLAQNVGENHVGSDEKQFHTYE